MPLPTALCVESRDSFRSFDTSLAVLDRFRSNRLDKGRGVATALLPLLSHSHHGNLLPPSNLASALFSCFLIQQLLNCVRGHRVVSLLVASRISPQQAKLGHNKFFEMKHLTLSPLGIKHLR